MCDGGDDDDDGVRGRIGEKVNFHSVEVNLECYVLVERAMFVN